MLTLFFVILLEYLFFDSVKKKHAFVAAEFGAPSSINFYQHSDPKGFGVQKKSDTRNQIEKRALNVRPVRKTGRIAVEKLQIFSEFEPIGVENLFETLESIMRSDQTENKDWARKQAAELILGRSTGNELCSFSGILSSSSFLWLLYVPRSPFQDFDSVADFCRRLKRFECRMLEHLDPYRIACEALIQKKSKSTINQDELEFKVDALLKRVVFELFVRAVMQGMTCTRRTVCIRSFSVNTIRLSTKEIRMIFSQPDIFGQYSVRQVCIILNIFIHNYAKLHGIQGYLFSRLVKDRLRFNNIMYKLSLKEKTNDILTSLVEFNISNPLVDPDVVAFLEIHRNDLHRGKKAKKKISL